MTEKFCKDCKHHGVEIYINRHPLRDQHIEICHRTRNPNPVTGKSKRASICRYERHWFDGALGCGPKGKYFEPKIGGGNSA